jgi:AAA family ATP:ADP antiporter
VTTLLRFFGLHHASVPERRATLWIAAMFFCSLASTFLLRPLRDQFGIAKGVDALPRLYCFTLLATAVCVPAFWWLASRTPSRRFVPVVLHVCAASWLLLAWPLVAIGDYEWKNVPGLGETFWGGFSAVNVIVPALVWIHAVEHFGREQGQRMFGFVGVGGTIGAVVGSWLAGVLSAHPWLVAVTAAALLEAAFAFFLVSLPACSAMLAQRGEMPGHVSRGGVFSGVPRLLGDGYLRAIGVYMLLLAIIATVFAAAQTEILGELATGAEQLQKSATIEFWAQATVLVLQLFCTGRLLPRLAPTWFLIALPSVSILCLGSLWLWPKGLVISLVQISRRGVQHSFDKPAREILYTPLDLETKHKVKFLIDTFVFRFGDVLGALLAVELRGARWGPLGGVGVMVAVACVWIGIGVFLGRRRVAPGQDAAEQPRLSAGS